MFVLVWIHINSTFFVESELLLLKGDDPDTRFKLTWVNFDPSNVKIDRRSGLKNWPGKLGQIRWPGRPG